MLSVPLLLQHQDHSITIVAKHETAAGRSWSSRETSQIFNTVSESWWSDEAKWPDRWEWKPEYWEMVSLGSVRGLLCTGEAWDLWTLEIDELFWRLIMSLACLRFFVGRPRIYLSDHERFWDHCGGCDKTMQSRVDELYVGFVSSTLRFCNSLCATETW